MVPDGGEWCSAGPADPTSLDGLYRRGDIRYGCTSPADKALLGACRFPESMSVASGPVPNFRYLGQWNFRARHTGQASRSSSTASM